MSAADEMVAAPGEPARSLLAKAGLLVLERGLGPGGDEQAPHWAAVAAICMVAGLWFVEDQELCVDILRFFAGDEEGRASIAGAHCAGANRLDILHMIRDHYGRTSSLVAPAAASIEEPAQVPAEGETMGDRKIVRISAASMKLVKAVAARRGLDLADAADYLIKVASGRLLAVKKDVERRKNGRKPSKRRARKRAD